MRNKRRSGTVTAIHFKPLIGRAIVTLLIFASLGLLFINKSHEAVSSTMRMSISDVVTPVVHVLAKPMDALSGTRNWVHEMMTLRSENESLKSENSRLQQWQAVATELESENGKLRTLLKFAPANKSAYTSARIAADTDSPYSRSAIVTSGENQGVQEDLAVINESGLVGRVIEVGKKTSRILLLTDMNSRVPVLSESSRERAIAAGGNEDNLSLIYLPEDSKMKVGEKIITSGDGGVLPPGLPVGVVTKIEKNTAIVRPFVDWYHLEYVSVVDFSM